MSLLFHLKRTIGNQAAQRMLKTQVDELKAGLIGTALPRFGHDDRLGSISPPAAGTIQTKLKINKPRDEYETAPSIVNEVLTGPGQPLDLSTREFMEPRFGYDFGQVRVHVDSKAARSAEALSARAFAMGRHIVFGRSEYSPQTTEGKRIIAHELAHVVQQGNAGWSRGERGPEHPLYGRVMRKERDPAPEIDPEKPAESWFYADDPTGHVASIYFDTGSSEISIYDTGFVGDKAVLDQVNLLLETHPTTEVMFEGYSDTVGDPASNQTLSENRAREIAAWLFPLPTAQTTVKVTGHGAQGPKATADNAGALSHYRRVDVIIKPPKETTSPEPRKSDDAKYGSAKLKSEMRLAVNALDATLTALRYAQAGMPADKTRAALERYFPHSQYRNADFLETLTDEIQHIRDRIDSVDYQEVKWDDISLHCSTEPYRNVEYDWARDLCKAIHAAVKSGPRDPVSALAFIYPKNAPNSIVLMPTWYRTANAASILVHEAAHLLLGLRGHPTEVPHRDPYALGGLVAALGGLAAPESDRRYPAPTP
jgi:outer membrane protein OmpA-like peptidoglycan-associated protein